MRFEQFALIAALSAPTGALVLAAGFVIAQEPTPAPGPAAGAAAVEPSRSATSDQPGPEGSPPEVDDLTRRAKEIAESLKGDRSDLVTVARERFEIQKLYFREGRITVDRMIDASVTLMEDERLAARDDSKRAVDAIKRHVDFMRELESAWRKAVEADVGTLADLSELSVARLRSELMLSEAVKSGPDDRVTRLERRIQALEAKLDAVLKRLDAPPR